MGASAPTIVVTKLRIRPLSAIRRAASRIMKNTVLALALKTPSYSSSVMSAKGFRTIMPAVLIRMSHRPNASKAASASLVQFSGTDRSAWKLTASLPDS
ncbi:Uncharacterised protein [Mycobacteroides abscessus subsp. abscessus]|nr:Uncharacterised protein [Mycobacteroides abscessus subsp. abscessus]